MGAHPRSGVIFVSSVLLVVAFSPGARGQAEGPSRAHSGYVITSDVNGNSVTTRDAPNHNIGTVRGFVLAEPDGQALYMIVDVGGFLGIGAAEIVIPFSLVTFTGQGGRPLVAVPSDMIAAAPRVTDLDIEQLLADSNWRRSVADFYGVQPDAPPLPSHAAAPSGSTAATAAPPTTAQRWYTAEQAAAGATDFARSCASCHGAALQGGAGPALAGAGFLASWSSRTIADLDSFEHAQMPLTAPGSLTNEQYTQITAFILQKNGFPAGGRSLDPAERALLHPTAANRDLQQRVTANAPQAGGPGPAAPQPSRAAIRAKQPSTGGPTDAEILAADTATTYWPFFNKGLMGFRYSTLDLINTHSAGSLRAVCAFQLGEVGSFQTGPIMYDGLLYVTTTHGTYALDATTCRAVWNHQYVPKGPEVTSNNKGAAIAQGRVIRGTQDGHLFALDAKTGVVLWDRGRHGPEGGRVHHRRSDSVERHDLRRQGRRRLGHHGRDDGVQGRRREQGLGTAPHPDRN